MATPGDIAGNNYDNKEYFVFKEEDPTAGSGGTNKWQEGILNWLNGQGDPRYHPPTEFCGTTSPVSVNFTSPQNETSVNGTFTIKLSADSTGDITQVDLYIDGSKVSSYSSPPYEYIVNNLADGPHELKGVATDSSGRTAERTITIGVGMEWNATPAP